MVAALLGKERFRSTDFPKDEGRDDAFQDIYKYRECSAEGSLLYSRFPGSILLRDSLYAGRQTDE